MPAASDPLVSRFAMCVRRSKVTVRRLREAQDGAGRDGLRVRRMSAEAVTHRENRAGSSGQRASLMGIAGLVVGVALLVCAPVAGATVFTVNTPADHFDQTCD